MVAYDSEFARRQKLIYFRTCVVCRKQDYFLKACSLRQLAWCCHGVCLSKHCSQNDQRFICVRNFFFNEARKYIPSHVREYIFKLGFSEISPHLYSIPRLEVYELMGDQRSVVLLQVLSARVVINFLQIVVQDIDGLCTTLNIYPPPTSIYLADIVWCEIVRQSMPPCSFILLSDCCWNSHVDAQSAAINIRDMSCITRLENTEEISRSARQRDNDAMMRSLQSLSRST